MSDEEDLENQMYGYGNEDVLNYGDDDDYGAAGAGGGGSSGSGSDDEFDSEDGDLGSNDGEGEMNFGETFNDKQRTAGGAIQPGGPSMKGGKAGRSEEDTAREKAYGIMNGEAMFNKLDLTKKEETKIVEIIVKTPNIERLNLETYILALLFNIRKLEPEKDFKTFFKMTNNIEGVDLLRYIRSLDVTKKDKK